MRPAEVTTTQIIVAGIQLEKNGKAVNGSSLRKLIGAGNPARLMRVWEETSFTRGSNQAESGAVEVAGGGANASPPMISPGSQSVHREVEVLRNHVQALQAQLEAAQSESANLSHQVQQVNVVVDAVTDDRNKYKLRCAELEGKDKSHQTRIAELNARIDEQRGELHRGSQARISLQLALDALLKAAPHTTS